MKGYDTFYEEPEKFTERSCRVCGTRCSVETDLHGPTGGLEDLRGRGHWHDQFICPHRDQKWHKKALELFLEMEKTHSKRLAAFIRMDLDDLLIENGIQPYISD